MMMNLTIHLAAKDDLPAILDVQKRAFGEVARFFGLKTLPPLEQSLESLVDDFEKGMILKASVEQLATPEGHTDSRLRENDGSKMTIIGSVRAYQKGETCHIGRLVVLPAYQNQGIGRRLMREIENRYGQAVKRFEIFTGARDPRNRYLYDQLGYKPFRTERLNNEVTFVFMEKNAV